MSHAEFAERKDNCDGRFKRDKERIEGNERKLDRQAGETDDIRKLLVATNLLVQQHEEQLKRQDARIALLEGKSGKRWEAMIAKAFDYLIAAGLGFVIAYLFNKG